MRFIRITILSLLCPTLAFGQGTGAVPVSVAPLSELLVRLERRAPAEVLPLNDATLSAEVTAVVRTVHADAGQRVGRGELLLELDDTDYRIALEQAEAGLAASQAQQAQAEAKLARARELIANEYLSADTLLDRETDVAVTAAGIRTAEAAVAVARRNLEKCRIAAPFDAAVANRSAQEGALVVIGSPLLQLTQLDHYELDADIPAHQAASLQSADSLAFLSNGETWPVRLLRLSPAIDTERRSRRARFAFTGEGPEVGRSGELLWTLDRGQLPANLVSRRDGALGVLTAEGGVARFRALPGAQEGRPVPVSLPPDTQVIVRGRDRVHDGDTLIEGR